MRGFCGSAWIRERPPPILKSALQGVVAVHNPGPSTHEAQVRKPRKKEKGVKLEAIASSAATDTAPATRHRNQNVWKSRTSG